MRHPGLTGGRLQTARLRVAWQTPPEEKHFWGTDSGSAAPEGLFHYLLLNQPLLWQPKAPVTLLDRAGIAAKV